MTLSLFTATGPQEIALADIPAHLASDNGTLWLDLTGPNDDDVKLMCDVFHFHPLAVEDTRNQRQRPKVEAYTDYLFMIFNPVSQNGSVTDFRELDVFVGKNYVVTVHQQEEPVIAEVRRRLDRGGTHDPLLPGYLVYLVFDTVVDGYFPVLDVMEEEIEQLGDQILENPTQALLGKLFQNKQTLVNMWRVVWPQREILNNLRDHTLPVINHEGLQPYLRDVADHLMWIADMVSTFRDTLTSIMDLYMSSVSNRLNRVVNRLTVFAVVIGVMTVIGGFYGMNFESTWPPFSSNLGVPFVIVLMASVTVGLLALFRRLKWF